VCKALIVIALTWVILTINRSAADACQTLMANLESLNPAQEDARFTKTASAMLRHFAVNAKALSASDIREWIDRDFDPEFLEIVVDRLSSPQQKTAARKAISVLRESRRKGFTFDRTILEREARELEFELDDRAGLRKTVSDETRSFYHVRQPRPTAITANDFLQVMHASNGEVFFKTSNDAGGLPGPVSATYITDAKQEKKLLVSSQPVPVDFLETSKGQVVAAFMDGNEVKLIDVRTEKNIDGFDIEKTVGNKSESRSFFSLRAKVFEYPDGALGMLLAINHNQFYLYDTRTGSGRYVRSDLRRFPFVEAGKVFWSTTSGIYDFFKKSSGTLARMEFKPREMWGPEKSLSKFFRSSKGEYYVLQWNVFSARTPKSPWAREWARARNIEERTTSVYDLNKNETIMIPPPFGQIRSSYFHETSNGEILYVAQIEGKPGVVWVFNISKGGNGEKIEFDVPHHTRSQFITLGEKDYLVVGAEGFLNSSSNKVHVFDWTLKVIAATVSLDPKNTPALMGAFTTSQGDINLYLRHADNRMEFVKIFGQATP
jgi:hypothetical protein